MMVIYYLQLPEEARELERELRQITKEKNEAVRSQDFEKVNFIFMDYDLYFLVMINSNNESLCLLHMPGS